MASCTVKSFRPQKPHASLVEKMEKGADAVVGTLLLSGKKPPALGGEKESLDVVAEKTESIPHGANGKRDRKTSEDAVKSLVAGAV